MILFYGMDKIWSSCNLKYAKVLNISRNFMVFFVQKLVILVFCRFLSLFQGIGFISNKGYHDKKTNYLNYVLNSLHGLIMRKFNKSEILKYRKFPIFMEVNCLVYLVYALFLNLDFLKHRPILCILLRLFN